MISYLRPALVLTLLFILLTGVAYPLAITGLAQGLFPHQANGSLISKDGVVIGSELIGQNFATDRYFWPRPSVTADVPYNAGNSSGSNLGPTSEKLKARVAEEIARLKAAGAAAAIPADAATASGSGLDPDISPQFAKLQVVRVAQARGLPENDVSALLDSHTAGRLFGIIGEPRVNVLEINLALDRVIAGQ